MPITVPATTTPPVGEPEPVGTGAGAAALRGSSAGASPAPSASVPAAAESPVGQGADRSAPSDPKTPSGSPEAETIIPERKTPASSLGPRAAAQGRGNRTQAGRGADTQLDTTTFFAHERGGRRQGPDTGGH